MKEKRKEDRGERGGGGGEKRKRRDEAARGHGRNGNAQSQMRKYINDF